jgi:hypothetical protein
MEAKKALEQIKSLVFGEQVAEVIQEEVQIELMEGVLADGTIVKFDKLEAGGMISVVTPDGEVPAPVGEHELEDGTMVIVTEAGKIAEVKMPEQKPEMETEVSIENGIGKKEEKMQEDKFAEITEQFDSKLSAIEAKVELQSNAIKQLVEFMETYAKVETAEETQAPKNNFRAEKRVSQNEAYKNLQNIFQTFKK